MIYLAVIFLVAAVRWAPTRPLPVLGGRQMTTLAAIILLMLLGSICAPSPPTPLPSSAF